MMLFRIVAAISLSVALAAPAQVGLDTALNDTHAREPRQAIDQSYSEHIKQYTTDPHFTSPLVDYLPASSTVPSPMKVLCDVAGAPDILPDHLALPAAK